MSFFQQFKWSITEPKFYPILAQLSLWTSLRFLLVMVLIMFSVYGYRVNRDFQADIQVFTDTVQDELPDFTLANGKFKLSSEEPFIRDFKGFIVVLDNGDKKDQSILNAYSAGIFVAKEKLVIKQLDDQQEIKLSSFGDTKLNKAQLLEILPILKWAMLIFAPILFAIILLEKMVVTTGLSLFGLLMQPMHNLRLSYRQVWNISLYALTLPWLIEFWLNLMGLNFAGFDVLFWTVAMIYFWLAFTAFRRDNLIS